MTTARPAWDRRDLTTAVGASLAIAVLGAPVGLAWAAIAPRLDLAAAVRSGSEEAFGVQIAADGWFGVLTAGAGLACAVVALRLRRLRGPGLTLGLAAGGLLAALVVARVGYVVRHGQTLAEMRALEIARAGLPLFEFRLRLLGLVIAWPLASTLTLLAGALAEPADEDRVSPAAVDPVPADRVSPAAPG